MDKVVTQDICQFNIFLKIAEPLFSEIVNASMTIGREIPNQFMLDAKVRVPHFSLYLFTTPFKNRNLVIKKAIELSKTILPIEVAINDIVASKDGLIMLGLEKNNEIYKLHTKVIDTYNPLRENTLRKKYADPEYFNLQSDIDKEYLTKYGHKYVLEYFNPHISVAIVKDKDKRAKYVEELRHRFIGKTALLTSLVIIEDDYETSDAREIIFESVK